ncbi:scm-like with four MBT domains protein 2 isoform X1 [Cuculus canorus]|uniref:scm-like with four MBT domains protein 2 isoform X1 n=2 Tax=Cuculus canorus TaxID=55661 RepID=UPI0023AAEB7D|nr:scm-like with four MBT domains protein 2 isoform X1 [Cuculus canorus]XP_053911018.1 scm-like with four MBT domains protein 2 isoform X1 [Cuculus canorus]XP_053911026.1 scm-like with four MBT domains protein 2 isoform X1 [Cuculus canorus]XP_053911035.1 scm-like with four MBT domains protein 2 isoform X1 [Cuculus canorus]
METRSSFIATMQETQHLSPEKGQSPANGNREQFDSDEGSSIEDADFNWDEYLEETGASAAPHTSFKHVEISLQSSFQPGMKLEVANKSNPDTYWVATIITTCGQLLLLRYCGYGDDRRADFWCDVMTADLHPVGWCTQNNKVLMPPDAIKEKYTDWTEFLIHDLTGARTAPANLLEGPLRGKNPVDLITVDSLIELQDSQNPFQYWIVSVVENVGGRLRLRYVGLEETESYDQWLFYLDCRLRPVGWCQENKYRMDPPADIYSLKTISEWKSALEKSLNDAANFPLPMEVFKDHADLRNHFFTVGMKLEAVNTREPFHICPASVTKVFNNHYLQVTIDDLRHEPSKISMLCHADSLGILPIQWCLKNGVNLTPPKGYSGQDFDWADYQKQCGAEAAPHVCFRNTSFSRGFTKNMKLEAVNPKNPAEICVASITSVKGRLMWIHLEGSQMPSPEYIVDVESTDIFPVGWCEANGYNLTPPHKAVLRRKRRIAVVQPEKQLPSAVPVEKIPHDLCSVPQPDTTGTINGRYCCPQLYINHRCFSGPYLNKGRIAELPQSVGPGKCVLVLKEVLSMVINAAYKPGSVLRELQLVEDPQWNFQEETLKAKYRGKTYRATVKIVRTSDQVADFCRRVCAKLECCPNLFSPVLVAEVCPENCSIHTKTKYTYYYGKRKKIIKPPIGENNNIKSGHVKPARRRKRRKSIFVQKKRRSSAVDLNAAGSAEESEDDEPDAMEDETGSEETSSELRDDQTDTSSAEVPSTRPRRAVTLRSSTELDRPPPTERARRSRRPQPHSYNEVEKCTQVKEEIKQEEEEKLILDSNPLEWTVTDVVRFIKLTDCAPLAKIFQEQDIDGQALLLLTLPTVQECMELKLGPAIKLCHQIERVKVAFYAQYAN